MEHAKIEINGIHVEMSDQQTRECFARFCLSDILEIRQLTMFDFLGPFIAVILTISGGKTIEVYEGDIGAGNLFLELQKRFGIVIEDKPDTELHLLYSRGNDEEE